jgi:hypothetical protein
MMPLFPALALLPGPPARTGVPEAPPDWRGQYHGEDRPGAEVVMEAGAWARLWRRLGRSAPPLDFSRWCAVVAFAGERPTGGYTLEILDPVPRGDDVLVRWRVRPPARGAFVTEALARPWRVEVLPRPKGAVKLEQGVD